MSLREVCEETKVSRRAIQGYEKAGLVHPTGRTAMGHLQYDEQQKTRIKKIKLFQTMGYSIKENTEIMDASPHILKDSLEKKVVELEAELVQKKELIKIVKNMIQNL